MKHKDVEVLFTKGVMDRLRDEAGVFFVACIPGIQLWSAKRGLFRGCYFLEKSGFVAKRRAHLDGDKLVLGETDPSLPMAGDQLLGEVIGLHRADWQRAAWRDVYQEFEDAHSKQFNVFDLDSSYAVLGDRVGVFDENGKLETVMEIRR